MKILTELERFAVDVEYESIPTVPWDGWRIRLRMWSKGMSANFCVEGPTLVGAYSDFVARLPNCVTLTAETAESISAEIHRCAQVFVENRAREVQRTEAREMHLRKVRRSQILALRKELKKFNEVKA